MNSVFRVLLALVLLFVLFFVVGPILYQLSFIGDHHGYRASCQSNMKQLGLALEQYTQDNEGMLPPLTAPRGVSWREATYPYLKSTGVYRCPDDRRDVIHGSPDELPKSYAANHLGSNKQGQEWGTFSGPGEPPAMLDWKTFTDPALTISVADTRGYNGAEWNMVSPAFLPSTGRELYEHIPRHIFYEHPGGTINLLFADGHVKSMKPMVTLAPVNLWTRKNAPFTGLDLQNARAILTQVEDK